MGESLSKRACEDGGALGAEGHPDADLAGPLPDDVGHDAEDADRREGHRRRREHREEPRNEASLGQGVGHRLLERAHPRHRKLGIDVPNQRPDGGHQRQRVANGAHQDFRAMLGCLGRREEGGGSDGSVQARAPGVLGHTDDADPGGLLIGGSAPPEPLSDGVEPGQKDPGERLVDHRHGRRVAAVRFVDAPSGHDLHPQSLEQAR